MINDMDGMMENSNEDVARNEGCWEVGICGRCVYLLRFDVLSGRVNVCTWNNKNRSVAGKTVKCDGFMLGSRYNTNKCVGDDRYVLEDGRVVRPGEVEGVEVRKDGGTGKRVEVVDVYDERDNTAEFIRGFGLGDDVERIGSLNEAERKFFEWVGEEDDKTFAKILNRNVLNRMRAERDRLDKVIKEAERRELDLIKARNGRIVWEKRLGCVEVEKGLEIGGVEIRNHREIEAVVRMFGEIEEGRKY